MYVPAHFAETDLTTLHDAIRSAGLATLVTMTPDGLIASHLPLLLDPDDGPNGALIGLLAIIANVSQIGFIFNPGRLTARWDERGDEEVVPRWARWESWWLVGMSLLQAGAVVVTAGCSVWNRRLQLSRLASGSLDSFAADVSQFLLDTCWHAAVALVIVGGAQRQFGGHG